MSTPRIAKEELLDGLRAVGLQRGDVVYTASSLAALGLMKEPVESTLWALREAVGPEGTLVMPTFNFGFCRGEPFDLENTPSKTGVLTEAFRKLPGATRTWAPPYHSVAAVGPRAAEIGALESLTSFGRDSAFQFLYDIKARILLIGCGYHDGIAHFHWLEELYEVPYRYWKKFEGKIVRQGRSRHRAFFMYARRMDVDVRVDTDSLGRELEQAGHVRDTTVGICRLRALDIRTFKEFVGARLAGDPLALLVPECRPHFLRRGNPVKRIDHIAIVSRYANKIKNFLSLLQCDVRYEGLVSELGVNCRYCGDFNVSIEFVDPTRPDSRVEGHIRKNPTSPLHHIALEVENIEKAIEFFRSKGYTPLDEKFYLGPKPYQRVMFLSPVQTGGLLVELVVNDGQHNPAYGGKADA